MEEVGEVIIKQQSFLEKFDQVSPPAVSQTLKEYITENNLEPSSNENFQKISEHANGLSSEHTSHGNSFSTSSFVPDDEQQLKDSLRSLFII
jgi:hypothetical protein